MSLESVVELDIAADRARVAELFADPAQNVKWMDDVGRVTPLAGALGEPGSRYRIEPKRGNLAFEATVVECALPGELRLRLDHPRVRVDIHATLEAPSPARTRLISRERFTFHGVLGPLAGWLARGAIRKAHRRHLDAFKRFAEGAAPTP